MDKSVEQRAVCICTNLWTVQTTNTYKRNTLVEAKTAQQAKKKVQDYLTGKKRVNVWPQNQS